MAGMTNAHPNHPSSLRRGESGNAIFYILAGIVLLAALSMAVSHSGRSTATSLTDDRVQLFATEILGYGDAAGKAAATLRLRGLPPTGLEFDTAALTGYDNPACGDDSCRLYTPSGGGIGYTQVPRDWLDTAYSSHAEFAKPFFSGDACVPGVGTGDTACNTQTGTGELIMFVPFVKRDICTKLNSLMSVSNEGSDAPEISTCPFTTKFTGTISGGTIIDGPAGDRFFARSGGCVKAPTTCAGMGGSYHFYQVLVAQ